MPEKTDDAYLEYRREYMRKWMRAYRARKKKIIAEARAQLHAELMENPRGNTKLLRDIEQAEQHAELMKDPKEHARHAAKERWKHKRKLKP